MFNIDEILPFFFTAMAEGYASKNPEKSFIKELPGSKMISYTKGDFKLIDYWFSSLDDFSCGHTLIYHRDVLHTLGIPVWVMSYHGWYTKEVEPFLKAALRKAYEDCNFVGGRGPELFSAEEPSSFKDFVYMNEVEKQSNWKNFQGKEQISSRSTMRRCGWYKYQGFLLTNTV